MTEKPVDEDDIYHCPDCGFEWSGYDRAPPYPHCPECGDTMMRSGPYPGDAQSGHDDTSNEPQSMYWVIHYTLWPTDGDSFGRRTDDDRLGRHSDAAVHEGYTELGAVNALLYSTRGRKSNFEVAEILDIDGPFEDENDAHEHRWEKYS